MAWWEGLDEARVLIAPEPSKDGNKVEQLLSLRHPKSGNATSYLCVDGSLQELHWFKQSYGSWGSLGIMYVKMAVCILQLQLIQFLFYYLFLKKQE